MTRTIAKRRINSGEAKVSELPGNEYHRTLRAAIKLSASSQSYQDAGSGVAYLWDNIAPEIARVIIEEAEVNIREEVIAQMGLEAYNQSILDNILEVLNANPDYALFTEKLALELSQGRATKLSKEVLQEAGIDSPEKLEQIYAQLLGQKKLKKNLPRFSKIKDTDDYNQIIEYLTSNPLYDKFLHLFLANLAKDYNKGLPEASQIQVPAELSKESLSKFLDSNSTRLVVKAASEGEELVANTLYVEIVGDRLEYRVIAPNGQLYTGSLTEAQIGLSFNRRTTEEELKQHLPAILRITAERGHSGNFGFTSTAVLKEKGMEFLRSESTENIFLSHLPAAALIQDETNSFALYQWLDQGNMPRLQDQLAERACAEEFRHLASAIVEAKASFPDDENFASKADAIQQLMNAIIRVTASLEEDPQAQDSMLDSLIDELAEELGWMQDHYRNHPLLQEGEAFPSTAGNFDNFVRKVVFNSNTKKVAGFLPDPNDKSGHIKLDLLNLVQHLVNGDNTIQARSSRNGQPVFLDKELTPANLFREQLKERITAQLKANVHRHHTLKSYRNDGLSLQKSLLSFRRASLNDTLEGTKAHVKKRTKTGEFSADSHLLGGQENKLKMHEPRSARQISSGSLAATESPEVVLRSSSGLGEVKILYILRGKEALRSHSYLDSLSKNACSEMAYANVDPGDYLMTILYNKDNTILGVIPGNFADEITGVNEFTARVLQAGIDFYNLSHDPDRAGTVKLPRPEKSAGQEQAASLRIRPTRDQNGAKQLAMDTLRPEVSRVQTLSSSTQSLPSEPFNFSPQRLIEVKAEARKHYQMRHVVTLAAFSRWTLTEQFIQENFNRILQDGFMQGVIAEQLHHAQVAQEEWLTDVLVPRIDTALLLNIAARLITDYAVDVEDLNACSQELYLEMMNQSGMELMIGRISSELDVLGAEGHYQHCLTKAKIKMAKIYPQLEPGAAEYELKLKSCLVMERNKYSKQRVNELVGEFLDQHLAKYASAKNLPLKPVFPLADNKDFVFLGAAASGKSTISSQYFSSAEKVNFVSLATDDYRGVCKPYTHDFEGQQTEQVFVRTQDSAYLISELVDQRMHTKTTERPNVIVDAVTYKPAHRALVEKNENSIVVCACLDDMAMAVKRSYDRAMKEDAGSADKGRHVNTTSLINMHKTASINLIRFCAPNSRLAFYDTNVLRGVTPPLIAVVDTHEGKNLTVSNEAGALLKITAFFNKARASVNAQGDDSLFFSKSKKAVFQIDSLFAVMDYGFNITLNGEGEKPYLVIQKNEDAKIVMQVCDPEQLKRKLAESSGLEGEMLKMLVLYSHYGSLKDVNRQCIVHHGKIDSLVDKILSEHIPQGEAGQNLAF